KNEEGTWSRRTILDTSVDISVAGDFTVLKHKQKEEKRRRGEDVCRLYEQNTGRLSPVTYEEIHELMNRIEEEIVIEAMRRTVTCGGRTVRYVEQILVEWANHGVETVDDVLIELPKVRAIHEQESELIMENSSKDTVKSLFELVQE